MEAQAILILSGAYLGYLPEHYAAGWQAQGFVRSLLPEQLAYEALFALVTRRGSTPVAVVRQFVEDLVLSLRGSHARGERDKELQSTTSRAATIRSPRGVRRQLSSA
jgi:DNA-binding transcriptional LysR family regulator